MKFSLNRVRKKCLSGYFVEVFVWTKRRCLYFSGYQVVILFFYLRIFIETNSSEFVCIFVWITLLLSVGSTRPLTRLPRKHPFASPRPLTIVVRTIQAIYTHIYIYIKCITIYTYHIVTYNRNNTTSSVGSSIIRTYTILYRQGVITVRQTYCSKVIQLSAGVRDAKTLSLCCCCLTRTRPR